MTERKTTSQETATDSPSSSAAIALVTGASKGIGAAIATGLAQDGFDIWLNYRGDHDAAAAVAGTIRAAGRQCTLLPFDVSDYEAVEQALAPLLKQTVPHVLVNNAGFARDTLLAMMSKNEWSDVMSVHLGGFYNVTRQVVQKMMRKRQGRIVNIVSTAGQSGNPGQVNYSAAKSGVIGATKALAREVAKRNVLVNAVAPGFVETEMLDGLPMEDIRKMIPLGRVGKPEEVAGCVRFLCSDAASYVTGHVLSVNGGIYT